jgi:hypothetical protein
MHFGAAPLLGEREDCSPPLEVGLLLNHQTIGDFGPDEWR